MGSTSGNVPVPSSLFICTIPDIKIPSTFDEGSKHDGWMAAMRDEMTALTNNNTWELTNLPGEKKLVGCKWMFYVKFKP